MCYVLSLREVTVPKRKRENRGKEIYWEIEEADCSTWNRSSRLYNIQVRNSKSHMLIAARLELSRLRGHVNIVKAFVLWFGVRCRVRFLSQSHRKECFGRYASNETFSQPCHLQYSDTRMASLVEIASPKFADDVILNTQKVSR